MLIAVRSFQFQVVLNVKIGYLIKMKKKLSFSQVPSKFLCLLKNKRICFYVTFSIQKWLIELQLISDFSDANFSPCKKVKKREMRSIQTGKKAASSHINDQTQQARKTLLSDNIGLSNTNNSCKE